MTRCEGTQRYKMAHIKSRKTSSGKKLLSIRYLIEGVEKTKATGMEDTHENREYLKDKVIPALELKIESSDFQKEESVQNRFEDFADVYLREKEDLKTYFEVLSRVKKILKIFGDRDIQKIAILELRDWVFSFKEIKPKTLKQYVTDMRGIYNIAIYDGIIESNPFDGKVKIPKHVKSDISPFNDDEIEKVILNASEQLKNYFGIAFNTGMRSGEIIALTINDIDFHEMIINVDKSRSKGNTTSPKTRLSIRRVPIFNGAINFLQAQLEIAKKRKSIYLFSQEDGTPFSDISSMNANRYLRSLNIVHRTYDTRHTFVVKMLNSGKIKLMDLARLVGHSNPQMILTTYAKYVKGEQLNIDRNIDLLGTGYTNKVHKKIGYTKEA